MPSIVYGNPVTEAPPVQTFRKNYPSGSAGLVTIDSELVRQVTASQLYSAALVATAQRLATSDELVVLGKSYGVGWTLTDSASLGVQDGFETVSLRYIKLNLSPLEYGNPEALTVALTDTQGIVKWHGEPVIVYESDNAREGFQLVDGGGGSVTAYVMPVVKNFLGTNTQIYFTTANPYYSGKYSRAYNLTLGGKVVAQAVSPLRMVRYGFQYYPSVGLSGAPMYIRENLPLGNASAARFESMEAAKAAGRAYYQNAFRPRVLQMAEEASAVLAGGTPVCGFTVASGSVDGAGSDEVVIEKMEGAEWYWVDKVQMYAKTCYIEATELEANNAMADPAHYWVSGSGTRASGYAESAWAVDSDNDTATCTVGGGVLLKVQPDSGGAP